ncbi:hypothetical protein C2E31_26030 [Rhodopirellula baltica]|nr:hypothetical protein C2E31_26030 [Rhodopirellula baltica]
MFSVTTLCKTNPKSKPVTLELRYRDQKRKPSQCDTELLSCPHRRFPASFHQRSLPTWAAKDPDHDDPRKGASWEVCKRVDGDSTWHARSRASTIASVSVSAHKKVLAKNQTS